MQKHNIVRFGHKPSERPPCKLSHRTLQGRHISICESSYKCHLLTRYSACAIFCCCRHSASPSLQSSSEDLSDDSIRGSCNPFSSCRSSSSMMARRTNQANDTRCLPESADSTRYSDSSRFTVTRYLAATGYLDRSRTLQHFASLCYRE